MIWRIRPVDPAVHELLVRAPANAAAQRPDLRPAVELYVARGSDINRVIHQVCQKLGHDRHRLIRFLI